MTLRLPKAELPAELKENMIKQLGVVPENVEVLWHSPRVTQDNLEFGARVGAWDAVDPVERAVFVLREVFDMPHDEVAEAVGRTPAAVRQIARRARNHVAARQPRVNVSPMEHKAVLDRFLAALHTGRIQDLLEIMAPDVILVADGGGLTAAALTPVHGAELVATMLAGTERRESETMLVWLNGAPAIRIRSDSGPAAVSLLIENGRITRIYATSNPQKLTRIDKPTDLTR
ncbi:sigma factor-like helix-turn-helix DNA-binding protein [Streptomyces hyaluromycini]|uniref:sigma factor-like helix-turn-helix DNA-binding protein n=1 Tax=Streptomyces hyaluromycini TaxID=1377993 RepID=UPI000B5C6463|nr:sigma factor-like helix-turn-helix DNA-binding protein [Streptomyces hyaluromycini]